MSFFSRILRFFHRLKVRTKYWLRKVVLPGFGGVPLYDVLSFFLRGIFNGVITYRASAIAFNFFLALIPFILFLFTLIPFMTNDHYQVYLLDLISEVVPSNIFQMVKNTVVQVISRQHQGLLSIVFLTAIYFATSGVNAIIEGFNQSYHRPEVRPWWKQYLVAFALMVVLSLLTFISFTLLGFGEFIIRGLISQGLITSKWSIFLMQLLRWFVILFATMLSVSILFYFGQLKVFKSVKYTFITVGSVSTTAMFLVGGLILKLYFENFSRYNLLYGSIGSLIILLIWIYYNSLMILIGFELDYSIKISQEHKSLKEQIQNEEDTSMQE